MQEEKPEEKKCLVYYKVGFLEGKFFGERFDGIYPCCAAFEEMFFHTGNEKYKFWDRNTLFEEVKTGVGLVKVDGQLMVVIFGKPIQFCPWSGHAVEVKKLREVKVQKKLKAVPDGYREAEPTEGWDQ